MLREKIEGYLSAALDQEACKDTLISALVSRVLSLRQRGMVDTEIIQSLESLCDDEYQLNDDVIRYVIEKLQTNSL